MSAREKTSASTRLATAMPGALSAVLLIGAVAFGASSLRSGADARAGQPAASAAAETLAAPEFGATVAGLGRDRFTQDPTPDEPKRTEAPVEEPKAGEAAKARPTEAPSPSVPPKPQPTVQPKPAAVATPKPAPIETQKPAPTAKPAPANPAVLVLEAWAKETKAKLAWTPLSGEGFAYYKVVRSADAEVTWPVSGGDVLVGVIGDPNAPWHVDRPVCGAAWNYRVFAVRHGEGGYVVLAASNLASVSVVCAPEPTPIEVKPLAFGLTVMPGQGIQLSWAPCGREGFVAYKVVRSKVNPDPRFPLNDGTELIAVIGDPNQVLHLDAVVVAGETWTYRVVAVTHGDGGYVPLCETAAMSAAAQ